MVIRETIKDLGPEASRVPEWTLPWESPHPLTIDRHQAQDLAPGHEVSRRHHASMNLLLNLQSIFVLLLKLVIPLQIEGVAVQVDLAPGPEV